MLERFLAAIIKNDSALIDELLSKGADPNDLIDDQGNAFLSNVAFHGKTEIVDVLIRCGAKVGADNNQALIWASGVTGRAEVVRLLLAAGADIHAMGDKALRQASGIGDVEMVTLLLDCGADAHAVDDAALTQAAQGGFHSVVQILLSRSPSFDSQRKSLDRASHNGHLSTVQLLAANPGIPLELAIFEAEQCEHSHVLQWLKGLQHSREERETLNKEGSNTPPERFMFRL